MGMAFAPKKSKFEAPSKEPAEPNKGHEKDQPGEPGDAGGEDISHLSVGEAVAEHGPAHKVTIEKKDSGGEFHVTSHHGDKMHHSTHQDHHAAMAHGMAAMGAESYEEKIPDGDKEHEDPTRHGPTLPGMNTSEIHQSNKRY